MNIGDFSLRGDGIIALKARDSIARDGFDDPGGNFPNDVGVKIDDEVVSFGIQGHAQREGHLSVDGRTIYQMKEFTVRIH